MVRRICASWKTETCCRSTLQEVSEENPPRHVALQDLALNPFSALIPNSPHRCESVPVRVRLCPYGEKGARASFQSAPLPTNRALQSSLQ